VRIDAMSKEMRDVCLCVGTIGLCCVLGFIVLGALTRIKVLKTVTFLGALTVVSIALFYVGIAPHVRKRLNARLQAVWCRY
jgi:hypothetical protein